MSTCREKIKRSSAVILSRNTCRKIGSNVFRKKEKRPCPFVCNGKAEDAEKNRYTRIGLKT